MFLRRLLAFVRQPSAARAAAALAITCGMLVIMAFAARLVWSERTTARLNSAAQRLDELTDGLPADDQRRAAIAWGYAERLRLGLESPFRLIEAASRDPRLVPDERRTVAWGLLAHVLRGASHQVDPASLDAIGPWRGPSSANGEQHLALIAGAIVHADDPRAGELAVRLAYTLAAAEHVVDGIAPLLATEAAALIADREVARREAVEIVRTSGATDPIEIVRQRRTRRAFYVERPVLFAPAEPIEQDAIARVEPLLNALRAMPAGATPVDSVGSDDNVAVLAPKLFAAGVLAPPVAALAVTVQRYLPLVRTQARAVDAAALGRARNGEMLVAASQAPQATRVQRRALGRMLLAAAVAMRSLAQERVWMPGDSVATVAATATRLGVAGIAFDEDVPSSWRPYFLQTLSDAIADLRRVLPALRLDPVHVRFRMSAPADSALAMHDPRSRTLHLPVVTAGGTLSHEIAHDIDRQSAVREGLVGYRSDIVARLGASARGGVGEGSNDRVAASLAALNDELADAGAGRARTQDRAAEVFATRVDWFVADALAQRGISSGFLTAVQDEVLTGHVVHQDRLRSSRSRTLLTALDGMTPVASFAAADEVPTAQTLLRWSLAGPVDRRTASDILRNESSAWRLGAWIGDHECQADEGRVALLRLAAESRARGWLRQRARWMSDTTRPAWAHAAVGQAPWSDAALVERVDKLRDYVLVELANGGELPSGLAAYAGPLASAARCDQ